MHRAPADFVSGGVVAIANKQVDVSVTGQLSVLIESCYFVGNSIRVSIAGRLPDRSFAPTIRGGVFSIDVQDPTSVTILDSYFRVSSTFPLPFASAPINEFRVPQGNLIFSDTVRAEQAAGGAIFLLLPNSNSSVVFNSSIFSMNQAHVGETQWIEDDAVGDCFGGAATVWTIGLVTIQNSTFRGNVCNGGTQETKQRYETQ